MPTYKKGEEKPHFKAVVSAMILISLLIAGAIYKFILANEDDSLEDKLETKEAVGINPTDDMVFPDAFPVVEEPMSPP